MISPSREFIVRTAVPVLTGLLFLIYMIARAVIIPVTHDEATTCMHYVPLPVKDIILYTDPVPNNHILNTLAIKLFSGIFGMTPFIIRLPNIIGFCIYFITLTVWFRKLAKNDLLFLCGLIMMTCNPYLIDFFSLARGYALSISFMTLSLYYAWMFLQDDKKKHITLSFLWAAVAVYASFTIMNYYAALTGILFSLVLLRKSKKATGSNFILQALKKMSGAIIITIVLAALCYVPVVRMRATDQFVYWGTKNFYDDTLTNVVNSAHYGATWYDISPHVLTNILVYVYTLLAGFAIFLLIFRRNHTQKDTFIFVFSIAIGTVAVNVAQFYLVKTPYLDSRTGLFYYPLLALPVYAMLIRLDKIKFRIAPALAVIFILLGSNHIIHSYNLRSCREWWFDENTKDILSFFENEHAKTNAPVTLNTNWLFYPSFSFHITARKDDWITLTPFHKDTTPNATETWYYATGDDTTALQKNYTIVQKFGWNGARDLMKHK